MNTYKVYSHTTKGAVIVQAATAGQAEVIIAYRFNLKSTKTVYASLYTRGRRS